MKLDVDRAFVLHNRRISDSKIIVKLLTSRDGALSAVMRCSSKRSLPRSFVQMEACWSGKAELKTLRSLEDLEAIALSGRTQFCGMYLNELLYRLLPEHSQADTLFEDYLLALRRLASAGDDAKLQEIFLRRFEFSLLSFLGVGLQFDHDEVSEKILADQQYHYDADRGFWPADEGPYSGQSILKINEEQWDSESLAVAKRISRAAFEPLLGGKPLKSRELFAR